MFTILFCSVSPLLYSQGLRIKGNDHLIDERTSYSVFETKHPVFSDKLDISFEMAMPVPSTVGYIFRIKNEEDKYIYNLLINDQGSSIRFKFSHEGYDVKIDALPDPQKIQEQQWIKVYLSFDLKKDSLMLQINDDRYYTGDLKLKDKWKPQILFGRSDYVIDIPPFIMRNLVISDNKQRYHFPLDESSGESVHNDKKEVIGNVTNPEWIINDAYHWKMVDSYSSRTVSGTNFNPETQEIYYFNTDSIVFHNVRTGTSHTMQYANDCPMTLRLGTNFIDSARKRLYVYEVFDLLAGNVSMAYLDLETLEWTKQSSEILPTQLHHHGNYFDAENRRYIIFGGFGNLMYNKYFFSYNLDRDKWETLELTGDTISPRYFTSMGYDRYADCLYVFGGMGNNSGDHTVGRRYFYDLYKIDLRVNHITKLWEIPWRDENVVPVRNLVVADDSTFYTLCYPEHFSNSELRLYRFSIKDGAHQVVGDSVPIRSEKITTNANLYYNEAFSTLFDIQQEFEDDDIASTTRVNRLLFPPVTLEQLSVYSASNGQDNRMLIGIILAVAAILSFFGLLILRRKRKKQQTVVQEGYPVKESGKPVRLDTTTRANAVYLFGEFAVYDRYNKDITYLFSAKLKQAFLLILQYSFDNGISSQQFSEFLWPDKSSEKDKLKNLRGVTLNHLRKILKELDDINLVHENGMFKLLFKGSSYCDYVCLYEIMSSVNENKDWDEVARIISRGKFLQTFDEPMFDHFRDIVDRKIDPFLSNRIKAEFETENYPMVIVLVEAFFNIDPINEDALHYLLISLSKTGREDLAKNYYARFISEYKVMIGEDYPRSYSDILS
ncbi:DNA-binding transcriptional activator [Dysgonomonas sp. 25]|nr:DNA-binding transcriptional activator [Dysgonomonas sp. 25]